MADNLNRFAGSWECPNQPSSHLSYTIRRRKHVKGSLQGIGTLCVNFDRSFYRRGELARRLAIFYAAQSIASAFSGLLAFGVFHIHSGSLADWRYLFLIEVRYMLVFAFNI